MRCVCMVKYPNEKVSEKVVNKKEVVELKAIDLIKPIESGKMNTVDYERSKIKVIKGIKPFY